MKGNSATSIRTYVANYLQLEHSLKGRIRIRFASPGELSKQIIKRYEAQVVAELSSIKAVSGVEVNAVSGSILVLYDPAVIDTPRHMYTLVCNKIADLIGNAGKNI